MLDRAKRWLKGDETADASSSQSFSVLCSQGHRLQGRRNAGYQALRCPTCGAAVFVLPASPLPEPRAPMTKQSARQADTTTPARSRNKAGHWNDPIPPSFGYEPVPLTNHHSNEHISTIAAPNPAQPGNEFLVVPDDAPIDGEIEWAEVDPLDVPTLPAAASTPDPQVGPRSTEAKRPRRASPAVLDSATQAGPRPRVQIDAEAGRVLLAEEPRSHFLDWLKRRRNPLIFTSVACIVAATAVLRYDRARRAEAPALAERGRTQGIRALDDGRFVDAYQILSRADVAVELLEGKVEGADEIRQAAREAALLNDLTPDTLESILDAATRAAPDTWDSRFDSDYKGRAVVLETGVVPARDPESDNTVDLDYRIYPTGEGTRPPAVARIDLKGFQLFQLAGTKAGDRVVFAARLASLRFDPAREEWVVRLVPDSGAFITHARALESLGWPTPDDRSETEDKP